jgi:hypothetical protein
MLKKTSGLSVLAASLFALGLAEPVHAGLINGGFELPNITGQCTGGVSPSCFAWLDASLVPGWKTTASDNLIEIWRANFGGVTAYNGQQHAELNATQVGTLYQDVSGIAAGSVVGFQFAHRGRFGVDTMGFVLTDLGANGVLGGGDDTVLFSQLYGDGNAAWGFYTGSGIVTLGNAVRFSFVSVSSAGGNPAGGNFLDYADFGVGVGSSVPEPAPLLLFGVGISLLLGLRYRRTLLG